MGKGFEIVAYDGDPGTFAVGSEEWWAVAFWEEGGEVSSAEAFAIGDLRAEGREVSGSLLS